MRRTIFLVDMNAFYITCEMTRKPALWKVPAAVAGDPAKRTGIILAANYPARAYGVKTAMTLHQALILCPDLITVPPDHVYYNEKSREIMALLTHYTPCIEKNSIDEAWLDMTGTEMLFGTPLQCAKRIMNDIKKNLSLWCSIGISENKFLAKMASDMKKPLGITELWPEDVRRLLWPLPVSAMYGIGRKTAEKLSQLNVFTIQDLALANSGLLAGKLGENALELQRKANGCDPAPLVPQFQDAAHSISRSMTLAEDAFQPEDIRVVLMELADEVGRRARKTEKSGMTVQIQLKLADFTPITRQKTLSEPAQYTDELFAIGYQLVRQHWPEKKGVRLIGIGLSGFDDRCTARQLSVFDLSQPSASNLSLRRKQQRVDEVMDRIREKHGSEIITRASLLKKNDPEQ